VGIVLEDSIYVRGARLLQLADRIAGALGILDVPMQAAELMRHARRQTGLTDFGDTSFEEPLEILLQDYDRSANLNLFGRIPARWDILRFLTNLLLLKDEERQFPAILKQQIDRPIFITGLPRSGTSFLHRLLAEDPGNLVRRCWETIYPMLRLSNQVASVAMAPERNGRAVIPGAIAMALSEDIPQERTTAQRGETIPPVFPGPGAASAAEAMADRRPVLPSLSILIPVLNEADNLPILRDQLTSALEKGGHAWEVVLANDGSTDGSAAVLEQIAAADLRFKVVHLRRNFGQTAALMAALDHSTGDIVVVMDADLQNDSTDIARLLAKLDDGYDVVSGWRRVRCDAEWGRALPSRLINRFISWMSGVHLHDYGCSLKAYRRWTIENVRLYGEMHRYIPIYANWQGARVAELAVTHHRRLHGASKYSFWRVPRVALDLLVIFFFDRAMDRPMQFFGQVGLYALGAGFLAGLYALWLRFVEGTSFIKTPLPLLVVLLTVTAMLCFFFGVIAEIQMRTYFESRDKRAYIVRKTVNIR
jgi:glycosyltransferase involved in cell wall biosynthesis